MGRTHLAVIAAMIVLITGVVACDRKKTAKPSPTPTRSTRTPVPATTATDTAVMQIVSEQFKVKASELTRATRFKEDLKADDLDQVELVMEVEDAFGLSISDDDAVRLATIGQLIDYVAAHRKPPGR